MTEHCDGAIIRHADGRWRRILLGYLELVRFSQVVFVVAGAILGAKVSGVHSAMPASVGWVIVSTASLFCASIAFNDWHDVVEDRVNRPLRPIPSGRVSREHALTFALLLFGTAIVLATAINLRLALFACAACILSAAYTLRLKNSVLLGNAAAAVLTTYPLWSWLSFDYGSNRAFVCVCAAGLIFRCGAELVKTAEDRHGDAAAGLRTAATMKGEIYSNRVGAALMCAGLTPLFFLPHLSSLLMGSLLAALVLSFLGLVGAHWSQTDISRQLVTIGRTVMVILITVLLADFATI